MLKLLLKSYTSCLLMALLAVAILPSCSPTKYVAKGKQLLRNNRVEVYGNEVNDRTVNGIIKQKPNKKIGIPFTNAILWRPYLMLYNWGNPNKEKGFSHWLTKIGEAPTIIDSSLTFKSAAQIGQYYFNRGYFLNAVEFDLKYRKDSTQANIVYNVYIGPQYYFNKIDFVINTASIDALVKANQGKSAIKSGQPFHASLLEDERNRLVSLFRNSGYYGFSKSFIRFEADTSAGNHNVNLTMIIGDQPKFIGDSLYYAPHVPYLVNAIHVDPNYNFSQGKSNSQDSINFDGLTILQTDKKKYKPAYLESQIHFKKGDLYSEQKVKETYRHLTGNRVFQIADISFEPSTNDSVPSLSAYTLLQPYNKRTFTSELELSTTAGNYGIGGSVSLLNRNIFKGGEILDFTIRGGLEAQFNASSSNNVFNTVEIGTEVGITFPRFLLAGNINRRIPKRMQPRSRLFTSYSFQNRIEFKRNIFTIGLLYNWRESTTKTHQINFLDLNYVDVLVKDPDYIESLEFKTGFQDQFIMSFRYTFVYDDKNLNPNQFAHHFLRASVEPAGNLLAAVNTNSEFNQDSLGQALVLGVPFAQYVKFDIDFRNYSNITPEHQIVTRIFAGLTVNYGNSPYLPPFEKSFFAGGSNDIRGWTAYRLGPGSFPDSLFTNGRSNYASVAPIKLMANVEYRFPIIKSLKGAIFLDAGNTWLWNRDYNIDQNSSDTEKALVDKGIFRFDTFYKQLATNTGLGFRYDFGFFALRLDMGMRIWDPTRNEGQEFVLPGLRWDNITYNIALGYPF